MACSRLLRGQEFKVSGKLFKRIEGVGGWGLNKTKEHLAKLEETVIFFLLKASVINLRRWFLARGTLTFKFTVILNCGPPNLLSAYFLLCFHLYSVCA